MHIRKEYVLIDSVIIWGCLMKKSLIALVIMITAICTVIVALFLLFSSIFYGIEPTLTLSLALAIIDTVALAFAIRELRERRDFLKIVEDAKETVWHAATLQGRREINDLLAETTRNAQKSVHHLSYVFATPEEEEEIEDLLTAIQRTCDKAQKSGRNVSLLFIGPPFEEKIDGAYKRLKAGAQVKFHQFARGTDFRFHIVDGKTIVIGVAEAPSKPSSLGYCIESQTLARILERDFWKIWNEATDYEVFVKQKVLDVIRSSFPKIELLSDRFKLPIAEIKRLVNSLESEGAVVYYADELPLSKEFLISKIVELIQKRKSAGASEICEYVARSLGMQESMPCVEKMLAQLQEIGTISYQNGRYSIKTNKEATNKMKE
jgi:hypothetical protein